MKSPIISQNEKGFLLVEMMLAFSIFILFTISTFLLIGSMQDLKVWSIKKLYSLERLTRYVDSNIKNGFSDGSLFQKKMYGNYSELLSVGDISFSYSDYSEAWGRESCSSRILFDPHLFTKTQRYFPQGIDIGSSNMSSDSKVRNGIVYLSTDSSHSSDADFFIIDGTDFSHPKIISSLNTGPGISALEVAGPYVFAAQSSTVNQLQVIDIHDRKNPKLITQLKVPLPTPTTTAPTAHSIFYSKGFIYLGTTKWNGLEFFIIDVSNIYIPRIIGSFETNTLINDIYVKGSKVYLATSDEKQMRILDVHDKGNPSLITSFSPPGFQVQEGKVFDYFENSLSLGRTVGGFNVITNHEIFTFSTSSLGTGDISRPLSADIPTGVYGILMRPPYTFLLTASERKEFQVFDSTLENKLLDLSLNDEGDIRKNIQPVKMSCDGSNLFFTTGDGRGISILQLVD